MSILIEKLKSFDYYKNKLPLYLQNSYGFIEHFKIWYDFLMNSVNISDEILALLNIFGTEFNGDSMSYLDYINSLKDDPNDTTDILDKLANLFGISRQFLITYDDEESNPHIDEEIDLSDKELLVFIKATIIKNFFDGTREQIEYLYYDILQLNVLYQTDDNDIALCNIYLLISDDSELDVNANIKKLFLAGLLNLESMGIRYSYTIYNIENLLIWDKSVDSEYTGWDGANWSL